MDPGAQRAVTTWAWHEEALVALRRTLDVLTRANVPALVVKGMVLAYLLYDDVALRPMNDVDLRVRPRDLVRAARTMRASGFPIEWTSRQLGAVVLRVGGISVELEASVGPPGLCALGVMQMMARSKERILSGGLRVQEPEVHDHAVLLVVNAFKDKFFGCMPWALDDLERIAERIDTEAFVSRISEAQLRTVTWIVADWMATERASARWHGLRERLGRSPPRPLYARSLRALIARHPSSVLTPALARIGSDSLSRRLWAIAATAAGFGVAACGPHLAS